MTASWIEGRVPQPPLEDVIKSALGIPTEGYKHQSTFYYPLNGGIEAVIQSLISKFKGKIKTSVHCVSINQKKDKWELIFENGKKIQAEYLISTIPLLEFARIGGNTIMPEHIINAISLLSYSSLISIGIGLKVRSSPKYQVFRGFIFHQKKTDYSIEYHFLQIFHLILLLRIILAC